MAGPPLTGDSEEQGYLQALLHLRDWRENVEAMMFGVRKTTNRRTKKGTSRSLKKRWRLTSRARVRAKTAAV